MDELLKFLEQGPGLLILLMGCAGFAAFVLLRKLKDRPLLQYPLMAIVFLLIVALSVGVFNRFAGSPPVEAWMLIKGEQRRILSTTTNTGRSGASCLLRTYTLQGNYATGEKHAVHCDSVLVSEGTGILLVPKGLRTTGAPDMVLWDLWTGKERDRLSAHFSLTGLPGSGEYRVQDVSQTEVTIVLEDGMQRTIFWGGETEVTSVPIHTKQPANGLGLFGASRFTNMCAGQAMVEHRSSNSADARPLLSALVDPMVGPAAWTVDLNELWGNLDLIGVVDDGQHCLVIAGKMGNRVRVLALDSTSGELQYEWTN